MFVCCFDATAVIRTQKLDRQVATNPVCVWPRRRELIPFTWWAETEYRCLYLIGLSWDVLYRRQGGGGGSKMLNFG